MIRNILLLPILCLAIAAQAQYSEPFSTPNKGYKINCVNDLTTVNWSLTPWDPTGTCKNNPPDPTTDLRDPSDYFNTTAGGVLESIDLDQEVCWESPLINTTAANPVSIEMDLNWVGFDVDAAGNNCIGDYIKVLYSVNGGAYTMIPNVVGGNPCATIAYPLSGPPGPFNDNVHINQGGIAGGSTLKIRVCVSTNANAEVVTIDNVSVPQAGVNVGCAQPTLSTVTTQVGCSNPNSGTIDLTVSGGTPGYTYSWTGGATTQDRSGLAVGTYTVTVTDAASCSATISATITNAPTLTLTTQVLDASCNGNTDGEISLDVTGGVPGYTYDWSNDGSENPDNDPQDLVALGVGTYTVTVTDATGCTATKSATVNVQPSGAYLEQFNVANKGYLANWIDDFAGVNWTMSGWTKEPPATFGRDMADFFRTSGGVLYGEDFDQDICWESPLIDLAGGTQFSVDLSWTGFDVQSDEYINVKYSIDGGGYVTLPNVVGGGAGTIQYAAGLDQSGSITVTKTGLSGGTIQIQVCAQFNSNNESMTIDNVNIPGSNNYCPAPEPSLTKTNVSCNGGTNGTITTTVTNGTAPFTYAWSDGPATTQNRTGLAAGTYTVTVTDANMATGTASITITQPPAIVLTETHVNVLCNGASTGSIDLTVSGGTGAYTYSWTGGATTQDRSGLAAGTYTVTVTDANACTKTLSTTITQPAAIVLSTTVTNTCSGGSNGTIDLTVSGGTGAYTYSWTGGATTQDRSGLVAGTYTVTVTDANGCTKTTSATISNFSPPLCSITGPDTTCANYSGIIYSATAGMSAYSWTISGNGSIVGPTNTSSVSVTAGVPFITYNVIVTITDANGCTSQCSRNVHVNAPLGVNAGADVSICQTDVSFPSLNGSVTGDPLNRGTWSGGTGTFTPNANTLNATYNPSANELANPGTIVLTLTTVDPGGACGPSTDQLNYIIDPKATVNAGNDVLVCSTGGNFPALNGMIGGSATSATWSGGAGTFTPNANTLNAVYTPSAGELAAQGTIVLTLTTDNPAGPCGAVSDQLNYTISAATVLSTTQVNVLCNGASTGSIDLTVSSGVSPYTYSWTGGATTQDRSGLAAGTYTVTVTDANGCTNTTSTTITQPTAISLSTTQVNVLCNGSATGSIDLTVSGGTGAYTYSWTGGATTQDLLGLVVGAYTVTVTDANSCTKTTSVTITQPSTIVLTETHVNVLCNGNSTGSIDLTVSGGVSPYTYSWTGGATTQDRSGLAAGTYTVTVTDANACTKTLSTTITEPSEGISLSTTQVNVLCNGSSTGSIDLTPSGGTTPYTYSWTGGATTQDRSSLPAGTYTVTVTDANSCTKTLSATITEPTAILLTETHVNVLCNGSATGSIDLTVSGGTGAYTYSWTGGATTQDRSGLVAGTYTVTVTDANSCSKTTSVTITQPTSISLSTTQVNVLCNGNSTGSIDLSVSGGTGAYTYSWTGGATTQDRSGLAAGTYTVTVTDANACTKTISATITEASALVLTETHVNVLCNGGSTGSIDLTVSGGVSPYTYSWTGGATTQDRSGLAAGTYTVTVTDANACTKTLSATITEASLVVLTETHVNVLCNGASTGSIDLSVSGGVSPYTYSWTGGATTQDRSGLAAGTYTVTVTDANACTKSLSATITEPTIIALSTTQVNVLCNGNSTGSIDLTVSGGTGAYTYSWTGGATTQDRSGLAAGTYTVTVTDANACTKTISATITEPTLIVLTETHVNVLCNGSFTGSIDLTVSGGTGVYTYSWTGGATTQDRSGLGAGTYTVTVTDANACSKTLSTTITETSPLVLTETHVNVLCNGNSTGSIDLSVSGGTSPYTYSWTGGTTTQDRSGLAAGTYTVTVTDANGCTKTTSVTITQPTVLSLSTTQSNVLCNGGSTGSIDLTPSGGTPAYTYSWTGGATTQDRTNLVAGTYTVTVTDANGCTKTISVTITQPPVLSLSSTKVNPSNCFVADGSIDLTPSGGTPGYTYDWSNDGPENPDNDLQDLLNVVEGTYTVTVTDANGCTATHTRTLDYKDIIPPTVVCKNFIANLSAAGTVSIVPANVYQSGSDNCGTVNLQSVVPSSFTCANVGPNLVTLTVNDGNGNTATCNATVTVRDVTPPVAKCKNVTANLGANGMVTVDPSLINNGSTDNCSMTFMLTPNTFNCTQIGMLQTVTLKATDSGGNTATCTAKVTVKDVSAPIAKCKNPTIFLNESGDATLTVANVNNGSTDNCGISTMSINLTEFSCTELGGPWPVTLSMIDMNGNAASCLAYVTVKDALPPTAVCEEVTVELGSNGNVTVFGEALAFNSSDNCSVWSYSPIAKVYTSANLGDNNLTITVKDWSLNPSTCVAVVTVLPFPGSNDFQHGKDGKGNSEIFDFVIFPNPTSGDATMAFQLPAEQGFVLRIFDTAGRMIFSHEGIGLAGENVMPLSVEAFTPGIYLIDFQSESWKVQKRLVVQK